MLIVGDFSTESNPADLAPDSLDKLKLWGDNECIDDVVVESYRPPSLYYSGQQRRCVFEPLAISGPREFVKEALKRSAPYARNTPSLPIFLFRPTYYVTGI